jgi:hypothetical protein
MEIADPQRSALLEQLVGELSALPGIAAIVLGGSYAEGAQTAASDMDIGLYYRAEDPFRVRAVREVAERIAVQPPTVTGYYAWGPWVNGGAWIQTAAGKVDFLYRNIDQVEQTIDEAQAGIVRHDFSQQPTFGFYSLIYLAETQICVPLYDPQHVVAHLKSRVAEYPPELKQRVVADSLWAVEFTLLHADNYAAKGDVYNTVGCLTRCTTNLAQALFALNEIYFLTDKRALRTIATFALQPERYGERLCAVLACPGGDVTALQASVAAVRQLWRETGRLASEYYKGSVWTL